MRTLIAFDAPGVCGLTVAADVERDGADRLCFRYRLSGAIDHVLVPRPGSAHFADNLWQNTCFEAFVRRPGEQAYLEFNFAPSAAYACYRFDRYRQGMSACTESLAEAPEIARIERPDTLTIGAYVQSPLLAGPLEVALAAVIELEGGGKTYWALAHAAGKPDFHHPDCFVIDLPPAG